jgi:hypothetical protein
MVQTKQTAQKSTGGRAPQTLSTTETGAQVQRRLIMEYATQLAKDFHKVDLNDLVNHVSVLVLSRIVVPSTNKAF